MVEAYDSIKLEGIKVFLQEGFNIEVVPVTSSLYGSFKLFACKDGEKYEVSGFPVQIDSDDPDELVGLFNVETHKAVSIVVNHYKKLAYKK